MAEPTPQQQPEDAQTDVLVAALVGLYLAANAGLITGYAKIIKQALAEPTPNLNRLLTRLRQAATTTSHVLTLQARRALADLFDHTVSAAAARADRAVPSTGAETYVTHADFSAQAIRDDLAGRLTEVRANILRSADDLYRDIVAKAAERQVKGLVDPQTAITEAYTEFVERGITAYRTSDGRRLPIESYAEMAVRTAALRAYNTSYEARLIARGVTEFIVPDDGRPCPLCWPWQGEVLDIPGIEVARAAGLFHPQCKHVLLPFFRGITPVPTKKPAWSDEQQAKYDATQRLRALERRVRGQKQARDLAPTPAARQAAVRRVRATEAAIRSHVHQHGLVRRAHRERTRTS